MTFPLIFVFLGLMVKAISDGRDALAFFHFFLMLICIIATAIGVNNAAWRGHE